MNLLYEKNIRVTKEQMDNELRTKAHVLKGLIDIKEGRMSDRKEDFTLYNQTNWLSIIGGLTIAIILTLLPKVS